MINKIWDRLDISRASGANQVPHVRAGINAAPLGGETHARRWTFAARRLILPP
jgi:hypothetical protein